jgi:hypothetical protein
MTPSPEMVAKAALNPLKPFVDTHIFLHGAYLEALGNVARALTEARASGLEEAQSTGLHSGASLMMVLKEECEKQQAKVAALQAQLDAREVDILLKYEVPEKIAATLEFQDQEIERLKGLLGRIVEAKEHKGSARERHVKRAAAWGSLRDEITAALASPAPAERESM